MSTAAGEMPITRAQLRVWLGIGLTWICTYIFFAGLSDATLDEEPYAFPIFHGANFLALVAAPVAQPVLYLLARRHRGC